MFILVTKLGRISQLLGSIHTDRLRRRKPNMERFRKKWEDYLSRYWQYLDVTFVGCVQTLVVQQTIRAYVRYKHNWRKFKSAILNGTVYSSSYTLHSSAISVSLISFRLTTPSQIQWSVVHHKHRVNLLILSNSFMRNKKCH